MQCRVGGCEEAGEPLGECLQSRGDREPLGAVGVTSRHRTRANEEEGS